MDKTAIKNYAVAARRTLMDAVSTKMASLYVFEAGAEPPEVAAAKLRADGIFLTGKQMEARLKLCAYLAQLGDDMDNEKAFSHVLEEVAYTWFNRLIALRYMEVNDYLPSGIRILSSAEAGRAEPDAMREAERLPYVDQGKISEYRADVSPGASERLYKYILISQCNALHNILPGMFQRINDYTELLLPDALYQRGGIVYDLVNEIGEDNFNVEREGQIQIIGWLYQYYISEKKDEVFAALKKNVKINKETIPAATQLFTPEWIVKYMVENSLGRLWLERDRAESGLSSEHMNASYYDWKYYVEEAEQEPEVAAQLAELRKQSPIHKPEDIKLIDPCMGSGHILVYAFDVLHQIYLSQGYAEREIPGLILEHNIYGLDIDGRAAQLGYFALMMKARGHNRRFFRPRDGESIPQPKVHAFIESDGARRHHLDYMGEGMSKVEQDECKEGLGYLMDLFADAREYGSILKIEKALDYDKLRQFVKALRPGQITIDAGDIEHVSDVLLGILELAECLTRKYDVVVTNPPYMAPTPRQVDWIRKGYPNSKNDLCVVFIERNFALLNESGYLSMITMHSWMFSSSYTKFRNESISNIDTVNLVHLGARAFEEVSGEVVQTAAFAMRKSGVSDYNTIFVRLVDNPNQDSKESAFLEGENQYCVNKHKFSSISNQPYAYWLSTAVLNTFENETIQKKLTTREGMATADNDRFLRYWHEVSIVHTGLNISSSEKAKESYKRWFPYLKGGENRKWYGNHYLVVNWANDGLEIKGNIDPSTGRIRSHNYNGDYAFRAGLTWTSICSGQIMVRFSPDGYLFDSKGAKGFCSDSHVLNYCIGFLNSYVSNVYLAFFSPSYEYKVGHVSQVPLIINNNNVVEEIVITCVSLSRNEWDSYETSWDFQAHPLIDEKKKFHYGERGGNEYRIEDCFDHWKSSCDMAFDTLKSNEEELNRIFIDIYGLQDELTPEVEDKDITIRRADLGRDIRSFLSYAVGCMFGRYSLDEPGLIYAGGRFDMDRYKTYLPEDDNILPIGSADYFDDDIVVRLTEFVRTVYGEATLDENLNFIADALYPSGSGSAKDKIRRYFLNDFYKDHLKIYQKRPIYWLMNSGKKDGFKALFYLHRYDKYTVARARTDYLHPLQRKYEARISQLDMLSASTESAGEKAAYRKEADVLRSRIDECRAYDQVVAHIAHQQIELDLDDGVKVNYAKFQGVDVPMDNGKMVPMDLLGKI